MLETSKTPASSVEWAASIGIALTIVLVLGLWLGFAKVFWIAGSTIGTLVIIGALASRAGTRAE